MADKSKLEAHARVLSTYLNDEVLAPDALSEAALACLTVELEREPSEAEIMAACGLTDWRTALMVLKAARSARLRELRETRDA